MQRYKFALENIRELRQQVLTAQQQRLAEAIAAEQTLAEHAAMLKQELAELQFYLRESAGLRTVDVTRVLESHRYELVLRAQIGTLVGQIEQVRAESEKRRLAVVEADRDVRVLDKLDERQRADFAQDELQREQRELDEIATRRAAVRRQLRRATL